MTKRYRVAALAALFVPMLALAGGKGHMNISIAEDDGDGEVRIDLNSKDLGFNLYDLQEGENRAVTDSNGQSVLITREADGFRFDVDGRSITMPDRYAGDGPHRHMERRHREMAMNEEHREMRKKHREMRIEAHGSNKVLIVTAEPLDDATQAAVREAIQAGGYQQDVMFVDRASKRGEERFILVDEHIEKTTNETTD